MENALTAHKDSKAWEAGFNAAQDGKPANQCPHSSGSIQEQSWLNGHSAGMKPKKTAGNVTFL